VEVVVELIQIMIKRQQVPVVVLAAVAVAQVIMMPVASRLVVLVEQ
jgi:hypothetical protein